MLQFDAETLTRHRHERRRIFTLSTKDRTYPRVFHHKLDHLAWVRVDFRQVIVQHRSRFHVHPTALCQLLILSVTQVRQPLTMCSQGP